LSDCRFKEFLQKEYENLITVDLVCHGVPSPIVWKKYLKRITKQTGINKINFRDKTEGWKKYSFRIELEDGKLIKEWHQENLFLKGFLQNIYLRPSCYECCFKGTKRISDITLADFWGIEKVHSALYDDRGASLVLLHSDRAIQIWDDISGVFEKEKTNINSAIKYNPCIVSSVEKTDKRNIFYGHRIGTFKCLKRLTGGYREPNTICNIKDLFQRFVNHLMGMDRKNKS